MNITSARHFEECFPEIDSSRFDTYYFSKASDKDYVFIAVKGQLEDLQVFMRGHYSEESLERRLFSIVSKYGSRASSDNASLLDGNEYETELRADMIYPSYKVSPALKTLMWLAILVIFEAIGVFLSVLLGLSTEYAIILITALIIINALLFRIYRTPSVGKDKNK